LQRLAHREIPCPLVHFLFIANCVDPPRAVVLGVDSVCYLYYFRAIFMARTCLVRPQTELILCR